MISAKILFYLRVLLWGGQMGSWPLARNKQARLAPSSLKFSNSLELEGNFSQTALCSQGGLWADGVANTLTPAPSQPTLLLSLLQMHFPWSLAQWCLCYQGPGTGLPLKGWKK